MFLLFNNWSVLNCSLGLGHDGSGSAKDCPSGINIMAPGNTIGGEGYLFSKCSSRALEQNLLYVFNSLQLCILSVVYMHCSSPNLDKSCFRIKGRTLIVPHQLKYNHT